MAIFQECEPGRATVGRCPMRRLLAAALALVTLVACGGQDEAPRPSRVEVVATQAKAQLDAWGLDYDPVFVARYVWCITGVRTHEHAETSTCEAYVSQSGK